MHIVTYSVIWFWMDVAGGPKQCMLNIFDRGENFGMCTYIHGDDAVMICSTQPSVLTDYCVSVASNGHGRAVDPLMELAEVIIICTNVCAYMCVYTMITCAYMNTCVCIL